eukprot:7173926-Prymnesium_polylepis.1
MKDSRNARRSFIRSIWTSMLTDWRIVMGSPGAALPVGDGTPPSSRALACSSSIEMQHELVRRPRRVPLVGCSSAKSGISLSSCARRSSSLSPSRSSADAAASRPQDDHLSRMLLRRLHCARLCALCDDASFHRRPAARVPVDVRHGAAGVSCWASDGRWDSGGCDDGRCDSDGRCDINSGNSIQAGTQNAKIDEACFTPPPRPRHYRTRRKAAVPNRDRPA